MLLTLLSKLFSSSPAAVVNKTCHVFVFRVFVFVSAGSGTESAAGREVVCVVTVMIMEEPCVFIYCLHFL